jgi:hypothetical protein
MYLPFIVLTSISISGKALHDDYTEVIQATKYCKSRLKSTVGLVNEQKALIDRLQDEQKALIDIGGKEVETEAISIQLNDAKQAYRYVTTLYDTV